MKNNIPDGDPVLALTDEEHNTLMQFSHAWAEHIGRSLPTLSVLEEELAASLICWLREPEPYLRNYTGAIIHWSRDGENHYAECLQHDGIWCHTELGMVRADLVAEYENGSAFVGKRRLTGVC